MVDGLGRLRHVSAAEDPELFWAVRGGGGDFGIITRIELRLYPAAQVYGGRLLWPADRMREVLHAFRAVTAAAPPELSVWFHAYQFPALLEVPEPLRGNPFSSVAVAHIGSAEEAEAALAPLRAVPGVVLDLMREVPIGCLGDITSEPTEPMPGVETSRLLERLDDQLIEELVATVGPGSGSPLPIVQLRHLGGAFRDRTPSGGCFGPVLEEYLLWALGVPVNDALTEAVTTRFSLLEQVTERCASGRTLLAFLGARPTTAWWSHHTRAQLVAAKKRSDPKGVIRSNRPVCSA